MNRLRRLIRSWAWWILANIQAQPDEIDLAIRGGFADCGLNVAHYDDQFDVRASGKFHEVLVHAARRLGNPLRTVADVKELLQ